MAVKKRSKDKQRKRGGDDDPATSSSSSSPSKKKVSSSRQGNSASSSRKAMSWLSCPPYILQSIGILLVGILVSLFWNFFNPVDPSVKQFLSLACRVASCNSFVVPARRTLQTMKPIQKGTPVAKIPRSIQIWDIDALRDPIIQPLVTKARHDRTRNPLASSAFLAFYLALHLEQVSKQEEDGDSNSSFSIDPLRQAYFNVFPKDLSYHPLLWNYTRLEEELRSHSSAFHVVRSHQDMIESEYIGIKRAWTEVYPDKEMTIDVDAYKEARIQVLTRSFSPGVIASTVDTTPEERELWKTNLANDLTEGCHALVPILDLLNHHPHPNVGYHYDVDQEAFVVQAEANLPLGYELYDTYGRFSDAYLFAQFGFNNGDGSGYTQASISIFHRLLDWNSKGEFSYFPLGTDPQDDPVIAKYQRRDMVRYLAYDDGYDECIKGPDLHPKEFELKKLKLEHLCAMANHGWRWIANMGPRLPQSQATVSAETPILYQAPALRDLRALQLDVSKVVGTCRLLSLTVDDYDGTAVDVLQEQLGNATFVAPMGSTELEYRSVMCVGRLASTALLHFPKSIEEEMSTVERLTIDAFQSTEWTTAQVRLGEMQTLQAMSGVAFAHARKMEQENPDLLQTREGMLRDQSCPSEYQMILLEDDK